MQVTELFTPLYEQRVKLYHGTSQNVLNAVLAGDEPKIKRVYQESNISLGGTYLTSRYDHAQFAASKAAKVHNSTPVVIEVKPAFSLYPDEDWVVEASEKPHGNDFDYSMDEWKDVRYREFFDELFSVYPGEGHSLSDTYKEHYDDLNGAHDITWEDSMKYIKSARQKEPLSRNQIDLPSGIIQDDRGGLGHAPSGAGNQGVDARGYGNGTLGVDALGDPIEPKLP